MVRPSRISALLAAGGIAAAGLLAPVKLSSSSLSKISSVKATTTSKIATSSTPVVKTSLTPKSNGSSKVSATASSMPLVSTTSVPGCPIITITTSTYNSYITEYSSTITQTEPKTIYVTTRYTYVPTSYIYGTTVTNTYATKTRTLLVVPSATTTITVPTNPGFTPILCEPTYYAKTTIVSTDTYTIDSYTVKYKGTTTNTYFSGQPGPSTVTTTLSSSTAYVQYTPIVTVTSTRPNPTSTVYAACASNNITPKLPGGYNAYFVTNYQNTTTGEVQTTGVQTVALDAADCCGLCQGNSSCAASNWLPRTDPGDGSCVLYIKLVQKDRCDPTFVGAQGSVSVSDPDPYAYMSNGACGQFFLMS